MLAKRRFRPLSPRLHAGHRATLLGVATVIALAVGASAALADTGSVYVDGNSNVAAGHDFFGGTTPTNGGNVGIGYSVMPALTTGINNLASGTDALHGNYSGSQNVATGTDALFLNPTGNDNVATGFWALKNTTGNTNIGLGAGAGVNLTYGNNNIDIANQGVAGESGVTRIGTAGAQHATLISGIWNKTIGGTTKAVVVNGAGRLGTAPAPAAPALKNQARTIGHLRAQVRHEGAEIARLRQLVQRRTR